ncbi:MAG TPA: heavy metal-binding domain-containing protein [Polyangiaceae bacterium]|jgi:uncharacterized protein YbjQ (UPF0145 family)
MTTEDEQSQELLARGGIPIRAQRRIHELTHGQRPIFTSTLTASETVVARQTGVTAISQVMGSSIYHVGFGITGYAGGEMQVLQHAYEHARSLALSRMQQEAALLGANLVLDVKFHGRGFEWSSDLIEFNAVGTAVRVAGMQPSQSPILTMLEPDELWKLHHAGYWPVGIAIGNSFWYEPHADCFGEGSWYSQELPTHTRAAQGARHRATERFRAFAQHLNAHGVVGVRVNRHGYDREYEVNDSKHTSFRLDLVVMGTAVVRRGDAASPPRPGLVIDLRDLPKTRFSHG